jgi:hypothetical protein
MRSALRIERLALVERGLMGLTTPTVKRGFWASVGLTCVAVGIGIGAGIQTATHHHRYAVAEQNAQATVAASVSVTSRSRGGLAQAATAKLPDGQQTTIDVSDDARYENLEAGDKVQVWIDPRDGGRAYPTAARTSSTLQAVLTVVVPPVLLAVASLTAAVVLRRQWVASNRSRTQK